MVHATIQNKEERKQNILHDARQEKGRSTGTYVRKQRKKREEGHQEKLNVSLGKKREGDFMEVEESCGGTVKKAKGAEGEQQTPVAGLSEQPSRDK
jgi:hypothetical protein